MSRPRGRKCVSGWWLAATLCVAPFSPAARGDVVAYTLDDLCIVPVRIVVGDVVNIASQWQSMELGLITTAVTVDVQQDLKGGGVDPLVVRVEGGQIGKVTLEVESEPQFALGQRVIVFLSALAKDEYYTFAQEGGKFTVVGGIVQETGQTEAEFIQQVTECLQGSGGPPPAWIPRPVDSSAVGGRRQAAAALNCSAINSNNTCANGETCSGCCGNPWCATRYWDDASFPIEYFINSNGTSDTLGEFEAVKRGARSWEDHPGAYFPTCYGGTTSTSSTGLDGEYVVYWTTGGSGCLSHCTAGGCVAKTYRWYDSNDTNVIIEADIVFNDNCDWDASDPISNTRYDVESTATHEFGHWLRANHSCCGQATMCCGCATKGATNRRSHEDEDVCAVLDRYPHAAGRPFLNPGCWPGPSSGLGTSQSYPNIGDVDNDGRKEIVYVLKGNFLTAELRVVSRRGEMLSNFPVTYSLGLGGVPEGYVPLLCDIDNDSSNTLEIIVGGGSHLYAYDGSGNALTNWPVAVGGVKSSAAAGDIDGDGANEVVAGALDGMVYVLNGDGSAVTNWPTTVGAGDPLYSSPALADLDGGGLDIVIGSDDGKVYALHADGTTSVSGWPQTIGPAVRSSPVVGDLDDNGDLEVVVVGDNDQVYAWHHSGSALSGFPWSSAAALGVAKSAALADLDGDGDLEILVGAGGSVVALHHNGTQVSGWPATFVDQTANVHTPVAADIDDDGAVEVIGAAGFEIQAFEPTGAAMSNGWPIDGGLSTFLALGDLAGNGELELAATRDDFPLFAWDLGSSDQQVEWGTMRHDACNTGLYGFTPQPPSEPAGVNGNFENGSFAGGPLRIRPTANPAAVCARASGVRILRRSRSTVPTRPGCSQMLMPTARRTRPTPRSASR